MVVYCSVLRLEAKSFQNLPLKFAVTTDDTVAQLTFRVSLDTGSVTLLRTLSYAIDQHRFQFNLSVTEQYSNYVTYALVILLACCSCCHRICMIFIHRLIVICNVSPWINVQGHLIIFLAPLVGGLFLWLALWCGTGYQRVWEIRHQQRLFQPFTEDVFYFQLTRVHSTLELSGWCALQIYLLTYLLTYCLRMVQAGTLLLLSNNKRLYVRY